MRSPLGGLELEVARDLAELGDAHLAEVGDVEVVPLAGGLELLLLLVFGDGGAAAAPMGARRRGRRLRERIALVGAGSGHMGKVTCG